MTDTITRVLTRDHARCDALFAKAEEADVASAAEAWRAFNAAMNRHFEAEEASLFPAIERAMGGPIPPIMVMKMEHAQMRELFAEIDAAAARRDAEELAGLAQTLLVLMEQHNMKEENVLYPRADDALAAEAAGYAQRFSELERC